MLRTILAGLRARVGRLLLSSVAIVLGVAFVTGTVILGDATTADLKDKFARSSRNVDVAVTVARTNRPNDASAEGQRLDRAILDAVRKVPGVAAADGRETASVPLVGANGRARQAYAYSLASDTRLREYDVKDGRFPQRANEVAFDQRTAAAGRFTVGQQVSLLDKDEQIRRLTLVGTFDAGFTYSSADQMVLTSEALNSMAEPKGFNEIAVVGAPGTDQRQLADTIRSALNQPSLKVQTGAEVTAQAMAEVERSAGSVSQMMLVFAMIALVVAAMVIYNTFTILVAQRTRELALLRCVGANRAQVFRSVLAEALAMGLAASVIGLFGGLGLSALLQLGIGTIEGGQVTVRTPVTLTTVLAAFGVGVLVTVVSAVLPARRATQVAPVAALRSQPDSQEDVSRTSWARIVLVVVLGLIGSGLSAMGVGIGKGNGFVLVGAGTMVLLLGVVVLGPVIVGPLNRLLGALPARLFGVPVRLASANAGRNPKRTAATTAALMIGVTIVTMATVVATSAKETINAEIDKQFPSDFQIASSVWDRKLPADLDGRLARLGEVAKTSPTVRVYSATLADGRHLMLNGVSSAALGDLVNPEIVSGDLRQLGVGTIALGEDNARTAGRKVGDTVTVKGENGSQDRRVVAIYAGGAGSPGALVEIGTVSSLDPTLAGYDLIKVKLRPGVSAAAGRTAIERATQAVPTAEIQSAAETKEQVSSQLNQVLAIIWSMIGLAVVIALFGIANTLTLSVVERTRELALLRSLGLTRGQLRLMLVVESILMAVMGAVLGVAMGTGFAWLLTRSLSSKKLPLDFAVPYDKVAVMLLAAAAAAVLAAALPARRAARTSMVTGMAEG